MISIILPSHRTDTQAFMQEIEDSLPNMEIQLIGCNDREARGKGFAIRQALSFATGEYVVFLDGDGDIHPRMIKRLIPYLVDYDIICGTKPISGLWSRRFLTYWSRLYIALLFNIKVDSQTGLKMFKRYALTEWYNDGFLFDLEILCLSKQKGHSIIEVPIEATVNKPMKLKSIWNTLKESITLWLELR